ncbi:MAG: MBL fold metallo-hydrolase [Ferrovibrio sp.]|jgi:phosphoribosyl 1,2-cyclic phosphodiesterase|nr:MBL fold metallo-hydrolase [Ferrovibrio sp.]
MSQDFYVRFWGVRGSIAVGSADVMRYGGNTSCLEIRCGEHVLVFDSGTGIRALGNLLQRQAPINADVFLTHTHYDHVCGMPHFCPFFDPRNTFRIHSGHVTDTGGIKSVLKQMMTSPLFPVPLEIFQANLSFHDFRQGEVIEPAPGIKVRTAPLSHPDLATGYRVEFQGKSICYLTDTEHPPEGFCAELAEFVRGADIVVYDSMYTPAQYKTRKGWGHSTWEAGVALCDAAKAKTYVVFHHEPEHDDAAMDAIAADVEAARPGSVVAREGMVLRP